MFSISRVTIGLISIHQKCIGNPRGGISGVIVNNYSSLFKSIGTIQDNFQDGGRETTDRYLKPKVVPSLEI